MAKLPISRNEYDHPEHFDDLIREYQTSERYIPTPLEEYLFELAGHSCTICKAPWLEIHHIEHLSNGGKTEFKNLIVLCPNCHTRIHKTNFPSQKQLRHYKLKQETSQELPSLTKIDKTEKELLLEIAKLPENDRIVYSKVGYFKIDEAEAGGDAKQIARKMFGYLYLELNGIVSISTPHMLFIDSDEKSHVHCELRLTSKGHKRLNYLIEADRFPFILSSV